MARRRGWSETLRCSTEGCKEIGLSQYDNHAEYLKYSARRREWKCVRHSHGDGVLTMERLKVEWVSEPSKPLEIDPADPYRSFGHSGVIIGEGFYVEGCDFPTGTRVKITTEILLPEPTNDPS